MIVVDSFAVVDALMMVDGTEDLRTHMIDEELSAPTLLDYEVVSAVRGHCRAGKLRAVRAEELLADFADLTILRWPSASSLRQRAFQLRDNISAYDAAYVALAEALDCPLLTRDARLARSSRHVVPMVVC